ncbi:hypothetical protein TanjilG_22688 [Lupinus angustifolius]|uniref:Pentatricopeptide repeat-containing protein n=1 Tax=Lupinus angustifolius TaxID=3871 RepID=A0A1J7FN13_LUPAN|nr:hypothetical protein TanjilG_22688 [Lupinus angustifolius]
MELGHQLHAFIVHSGYREVVSVLNGLVDFYGKCWDIVSSEMVINRIRQKNVVSCYFLIYALMQNHKEEQACMVFLQARNEEVELIDFIESSVLSACAELGGSDWVFSENPKRNLVTWNARISGYAHQGNVDMALCLFEETTLECCGKTLSYVILVSGLSVCSRVWAVERRMQIFESMRVKYGIEPSGEHYACVVDLLWRARLVEDAYEFIKIIC